MPSKATILKRNIEVMRELLETNDAALESAILMIYDQQTLSEKEVKATKEHNKVGFTGTDAELLSSFAEQILDRRSKGIQQGRCLSQPRNGREGQIGWARRKMLKYAGQLVRLEWTYDGPVVRPEEGSTLLAESRESVQPGETTSPGIRSRLDALEDAYRRIHIGREFVVNNPDNERAITRLQRLVTYADQLILDSKPSDYTDRRFMELAAMIKPCEQCKGLRVVTDKSVDHVCYRCSGKGFQSAADEERNERYDRQHPQRRLAI